MQIRENKNGILSLSISMIALAIGLMAEPVLAQSNDTEVVQKERAYEWLNSQQDKRFTLQLATINGFENCYCLLYTSPSPRDKRQSRMPSSA